MLSNEKVAVDGLRVWEAPVLEDLGAADDVSLTPGLRPDGSTPSGS